MCQEEAEIMTSHQNISGIPCQSFLPGKTKKTGDSLTSCHPRGLQDSVISHSMPPADLLFPESDFVLSWFATPLSDGPEKIRLPGARV